MKIYVSPMAGVTDYSYRKIMEKFKPNLMFTEMVNAHLMEIEDTTTINELLKCDNFENTGAQVFGNQSEEIINAFLKIEKIGFSKINLNMGCPQPKIIKNGSGCGLLPRTEFMDDLLCTLKSKLKSTTKLSIKIRIGYKDFNNPQFYINLANKYNLDFICVHGRTQEQIYSGFSDWDALSKLSHLPRNIDFIGNGDLINPLEIPEKIRNSKLEGIMLARGIVGNPWLIAQSREILTTRNIATIPTFENIKDILIEHFSLLAENKGEETASMEINKFIRPYFKKFLDQNTSEIINLSTYLKEIIMEREFFKKMNKIQSL